MEIIKTEDIIYIIIITNIIVIIIVAVENNNSIQFKFILRNIQLQRAYKKEHLTAIHVVYQEIYRLATLDYGQRWLELNPFSNNKHQLIITCYINYVTLNLNKILQLSFPFSLYTICTVLHYAVYFDTI